jgi:hypothetical protein
MPSHAPMEKLKGVSVGFSVLKFLSFGSGGGTLRSSRRNFSECSEWEFSSVYTREKATGSRDIIDVYCYIHTAIVTRRPRDHRDHG